MLYNKLGRTGVDVSKVGLGCEHMVGMPQADVSAIIGRALDAGVNYMDIFMSQSEVRDRIGCAVKGRRDKVMLQGMLGSITVDDACTKTTDPVSSMFYYEDFLKRMHTDYADTCMLFFVDEQKDFDAVFGPGGNAEAALKLKEQGKCRFIGMSCHNPLIALQAVKTGLLDVLMFPVNPAHDTRPGTENIDQLFDHQRIIEAGSVGVHPDRALLYETCAALGTAIVVMKTYAAGWLLGEDAPTGLRMTPEQLIHYALSQPGVASALPGCRSVAEMDAALKYLDATDAQRDFSFIANTSMFDTTGKCMYCNHCLPCPSNIDVAAVMRLLDAAKREGVTPGLREAYGKLQSNASDCIECGGCEALCPFHVPVIERMKKTVEVFA